MTYADLHSRALTARYMITEAEAIVAQVREALKDSGLTPEQKEAITALLDGEDAR